MKGFTYSGMVSGSLFQKCLPYLSNLKRKAPELAFDLFHYKEAQGESAVAAMERYIDISKKQGRSDTEIAQTIAHDLYGCDKPCFAPRTATF